MGKAYHLPQCSGNVMEDSVEICKSQKMGRCVVEECLLDTSCLSQFVLTRALIICIEPTHDWPANISSSMADGKRGPTLPE